LIFFILKILFKAKIRLRIAKASSGNVNLTFIEETDFLPQIKPIYADFGNESL